MPTRRMPSAFSTAIFTGSFCVDLMNTPVSFCGEKRENSEVVAPPTSVTSPSNWTPGYESSRTVALLPGLTKRICVSSTLASTQ